MTAYACESVCVCPSQGGLDDRAGLQWEESEFAIHGWKNRGNTATGASCVPAAKVFHHLKYIKMGNNRGWEDDDRRGDMVGP